MTLRNSVKIIRAPALTRSGPVIILFVFSRPKAVWPEGHERRARRVARNDVAQR